MRENLFKHLDIAPENTYIENGMAQDERAECERYNVLLENLPRDIQLLGLGSNGHIAFNEPFTPFGSETHVATALKEIKALQELVEDEQPEKVFGYEVWRNLDWLNDDEKVYLDCSAHPNLSRALSSVFDSQIIGGKRYDLAAEGRRLANATFSESHACDTYTMLNYAMDLTPLIKDKSLDIADYVAGFIKRFESNVRKNIMEL